MSVVKTWPASLPISAAPLPRGGRRPDERRLRHVGWGLSRADPAHIEVVPGPPKLALGPGEHRLGLDDERDGAIYVPRVHQPGRPSPLAVMLHGAGGNGDRMRFTFALADEFGMTVLAPDSRGGTWDFVRGGFGPDVAFIGAALQHVFDHVAVDPKHLAIGGFSDGASYALSLGLANGRLFTHVLAFSPGFIVRTRVRGRPRIFVSHGAADRVLPINQTSRRIVADLKEYRLLGPVSGVRRAAHSAAGSGARGLHLVHTLRHLGLRDAALRTYSRHSLTRNAEHARRVVVVDLLQDAIRQPEPVDPPAALRRDARGRVVEVLVLALEEPVVDLVSASPNTCCGVSSPCGTASVPNRMRS